MTEEVTETHVELERPYWIAGIVTVVVSFVILGFTLGVLARCGGGRGICFDYGSHAAGDAGLIFFVITLIVGVALMAYTGSATAFSTRTQIREAPTPPATTVILSQTAPAPQSAITSVYPQAPVTPSTPVILVPPQ